MYDRESEYLPSGLAVRTKSCLTGLVRCPFLHTGAAVFRPDPSEPGTRYRAKAESKPLRTPPRCHQAAGGSYGGRERRAERWAEKGDAGRRGGGAQMKGPAGGAGAGSRGGLRNRRGAASGAGTAGSTPLGLIPEWGARPAGAVGPGGPRAPLAAAPGPAARPGPRSPSPRACGAVCWARPRVRARGPPLPEPRPPRPWPCAVRPGPEEVAAAARPDAGRLRPLRRRRPPARPAVPVRGARSSLAGPRRSVRRRAAAVSARPVHTASWEPAQAREASWRQRGRTAPPAAREPNGRRPPRRAPPRPADPRQPRPSPPRKRPRARAESPRDPAPHLPLAASRGRVGLWPPRP